MALYHWLGSEAEGVQRDYLERVRLEAERLRRREEECPE